MKRKYCHDDYDDNDYDDVDEDVDNGENRKTAPCPKMITSS